MLQLKKTFIDTSLCSFAYRQNVGPEIALFCKLCNYENVIVALILVNFWANLYQGGLHGFQFERMELPNF